MATAVESPSIASARERAAAILYGNERPLAEITVPVEPETVVNQPTPVIAPTSAPKVTPTFVSYQPNPPLQHPAPAPAPYQTPYELPDSTAIQVVHPIVDPNKITHTNKQVVSEIDQELEEDTQYVVRFKAPTLIAAGTMAIIFALMVVLFVVNIVSLASTASAVHQLLEEEQVLDQQIAEALAANEQAQAAVTGQVDFSKYQNLPQTPISTEQVNYYQTKATTNSSGGFFDWVCHTLSQLFG